MQPSSSNTGFFQQQPIIRNQFHDDVSLQRITKLFLPSSVLDQTSSEISQLADDVLSQQVFDWITDAEHSQPYLRGGGRDAFGKPTNELVVTEGWRRLQDLGFQKGVIAVNYDSDYGPFNRLAQFIRCHLWEGSCANTLCPAAMQDGAARLLQRHLSRKSGLSPIERKVFQNAYDHLTSRDPAKAWTSGQWMTERTGGSDVSQTETVATYDPYPDPSAAPLADVDEKTPLGPWSVSGFKWFSSATDSQMTILLAKTDPSKGVSAFLAPMRRHNPSLVSATGVAGGSELNGITIQRLKHKFGTQSLPTAELELKNMRAWLIGEEGKGIYEISTILTITRVHTTVSSVGYLGRSLGVAKGFAAVREVGVGRGRRLPLSSHPLHMRTLANLTIDYHGLMLLVYYTVFLLGLSEKLPTAANARTETAPPHPLTPPARLVGPLLRALSSLHKSYVAHTAVPLIYTAMQSLGGVGYLLNEESQHINIARLFRDACVSAIWEGTTDVLAGDTIRAIKHPRDGEDVLKGLTWVVETGLDFVGGGDGGKAGWVAGVRRAWGEVKGRLEREAQGELLPDARAVVFRVAEVLLAVLYMVDAAVRPGAEIEEMCRRYLVEKAFAQDAKGVGKKDVAMDQAIVYGAGKVPGQGAAGVKL
ncbi:acyl-CoA dehydrogenase/oxidase [Corynascus novoguineensis]|uniref:Acyl-CoA dehydrogenase/oxidase n=1 Tax=Corynascus novoguineensis TaxID=1126955 RepID=A0AAN7D123_9PEZI|nr:acyl-CoA dehydrogenase/oxidase [Corynascus novoguineensis]